MPTNKKCVGVVFGGASGEHNVSIKSAKTVVSALEKGSKGSVFEVICFYIDRNGEWWPHSIAKNVLKTETPLIKDKDYSSRIKGFCGFPSGIEKVEVWYPVLHGPNGEDGTIQGLFTLTGKPFVGSGVLGSALGMDKIVMKAAFSAAKLPQVPFYTTNSLNFSNEKYLEKLINDVENNLDYPCFIKPANLGSSVGISKAYNKKDLINGLKLACKHDERILVEKAVKARELECGILGKNEMKVSEIGEVSYTSDWYDYETKYSSTSSKVIVPADLSKKVRDKVHDLSIAACESLCVDSIARVDFFYDEMTNEIFINEVNTLPGFTKQSMYPMLWEASGLTIEELVAQLVETATK